MKASFFLFLVFFAMGTAFYGGFLWSRKAIPEPETVKKAIQKTDLIIANAKISDIRVQTETKFAIKASQKTSQKKKTLEQIQQTKEKKDAQPDNTERDAMCDLIQAQDEELTAIRALNVELTIGRDSWKNACNAAREQRAIEKIQYDAQMAAVRGQKIRVGIVSFGIGLVGGLVAK